MSGSTSDYGNTQGCWFIADYRYARKAHVKGAHRITCIVASTVFRFMLIVKKQATEVFQKST